MSEQNNPKASNFLKDTNFYQKVAIAIFIIAFIVGFALAQNDECTGSYYRCDSSIDSTILFTTWISGFFSSMFLYGFGEIIKQLQAINKKIK